MADSMKLGVMLVSILVLVSARNSSFQDCNTKLSVLETALYETGNNTLELNRIFFPPNRQTSRFIIIVYLFQNETGELDGCDVSYIWAIGGFLLMQPPTIFQFTSLFFNYPNNDLQELRLQLPYECRPLIITSSSNCSCFGDNTDLMLNILTQQITIYARFNAPENVERENNYARAVCASELQKNFYSNKKSRIVYTLICLVIFFPVFLIVLCVCALKKAREVIHSLSKPSKHGTTVAMSLIGVYISLTIYVMDILACRSAITGNHEYRDDIDNSSLNVTLMIGTLIIDTIFLLPLIFGLSCALFICCKEIYDGKEVECNLPSNLKCLSVCYNKVIKKEDTSKDNIFLCMLVSPLLCISSHVGFILMAWLTEPTKSTTVFILYYFVFVYLFLVFRECYRSLAKGCHLLRKRCSVQNQNPGTSSTTKNNNAEGSSRDDTENVEMNVIENPENPPQDAIDTTSTKKQESIDMQAFCILLVLSVFIVGIPVMIALAFILIPLETADLVTYIFQLFQLLVVMISTIFIYQLFSTQKFNIDKFLKVFHKNIKENESTNNTDSREKEKSERPTDTEKAGKIAARLTNTILAKRKDEGTTS